MSPVRLFVGVLFCFGCGPKVEGQSHRHLAKQWCQDYAERYTLCSPSGPPEDITQEELEAAIERRASTCERNPAWDWTDECGDLAWAYRECHASLTCEEYKLIWGPQETDPCQEPEQDYYGRRDCPR